MPDRSAINNAHAYVAAPYGLYKTASAYIALAMTDIVKLGHLLGCDALKEYINPDDWFDKRDEIKQVLVLHLLTNTAEHWLGILEEADIWCAPVYDYDALTKQEGYKVLNMEITTKTSKGLTVKTTRCPIKVDGNILVSTAGAPYLGEHNKGIEEKYGLSKTLQPAVKPK